MEQQPKYKLYYSYVSDMWVVDQSKPWHYQRGRMIGDLVVEDICTPTNGVWDYYINLDKFKSCNQKPTQAIHIIKYTNKIMIGIISIKHVGLGRQERRIKELEVIKPTELQNQIEKYIKLSYMI